MQGLKKNDFGGDEILFKILFSEEVFLLRKFNAMFGPVLIKKLFSSLHMSCL